MICKLIFGKLTKMSPLLHVLQGTLIVKVQWFKLTKAWKQPSNLHTVMKVVFINIYLRTWLTFYLLTSYVHM